MAQDVNINIVVDTKGVNAGVKSITDSLKTAQSNAGGLSLSLNKVTSGFSGMIESASLVKNAILGIGAGIVAMGASFVGMKIIEEARAQEDAVNRLNASLANAGNFSKMASEGLIEYAETIQRTTRFSDDQVLSNLSLLESLTNLDSKGLQRAQTAALNLSTALGMDLNTATMLVAKAASGHIETFNRYGIAIQKGKNEAQTFANALSVLEKQFGGRAKGDINSFGGAVVSLSNVFDDLLKNLGLAIIKNPQFVTSIKMVTSAIIELTDTIQGGGYSAFINEVVKYSSLGIGLVGALASGIYQTVVVFKNVLEIVADLAGKSLYGIVLKVENTLNSLAKAVPTLFSALQNDTSKTEQIFNNFTVALEKNKKDLDQAFNGKNIFDSFSKNAFTVYENAKSSFNKPIEFNFKNNQQSIKVSLEEQDKLRKDMERAAKQESERLAQIVKDTPITSFIQVKLATSQSEMGKDLEMKMAPVFDSGDIRKRFEDLVSGLPKAIMNGAEGAREVMAKGAALVGEMIVPGMGGVIGDAVNLLSQTPEVFRKMMIDFISGFADMIANIIINLINLPEIIVKGIEAFIAKLPDLVNKIVYAFVTVFANPMFIVKLAFGLVQAVLAAIPAIVEGFLDGLLDGLKDGIGEMFNELMSTVSGGLLGGDSGGGIFGDILNVGTLGLVGGGPIDGFLGTGFGFAEGGQGYVKRVPNGFPNDSYRAFLTEGELVVDRSTATGLRDFIDSKPDQNSAITNSLLAQVVNLLGNPIQVSSDVKVNQSTLANIILNLNRRNERLA